MESNHIKADMKVRMVAGPRCFYALQKAPWFNNLSKNDKIMTYNMIIRPEIITVARRRLSRRRAARLSWSGREES